LPGSREIHIWRIRAGFAETAGKIMPITVSRTPPPGVGIPTGHPQGPSAIDIREADVLVLGCGLAGLRAAWAAAQTSPALSVTVICPCTGPSGSSFTNRNNALGVQLLDTDERRRIFADEVLALGSPGRVDAKLVKILAEESPARVKEMEALGLAFRRNAQGTLLRFPGCGSGQATAAIFDNLADAFNRYKIKTAGYGAEFLTGLTISGIIRLHGRACGAWGYHPESGRITAVRARTVIMALGGPAPLFSRHQAGTLNPGTSLGILADAGVTTANEPYLQFMWGKPDAQFLNPAHLMAPGNGLRLADGTWLDPARLLAPDLDVLRAERLAHCPAFFHRPQALLDRLLLAGLHTDGFARVETTSGTVRAGLFAHAGNGGAVVNEHGATSLPGLYALGECATGMHGANRMGGAMVLATQVFGRRSGMAAAQLAGGTPLVDAEEFKNQCLAETKGMWDSPEERDIQERIRTGLTRHALFGGVSSGDSHGSTGAETFRHWLATLADSGSASVRTMAKTARLVSRPIDDPYRITGLPGQDSTA
jgi:succinate dehydrogenase/fumarate reductase flavoprotein subunit